MRRSKPLSRLVRAALTATVLSAALPVFALTATQSVEKEIQTQGADGTVAVRYAPATLVTPGETIIYRLDIENDGTEPAADLRLVMPVPEVITYIEGSAERDDAVVTYSADAGQSYAARNALRVISEDGTKVPALADDITHVKWTLKTPISPGQKDTLAFKGKLK